jgi:hypothetical protein
VSKLAYSFLSREIDEGNRKISFGKTIAVEEIQSSTAVSSADRSKTSFRQVSFRPSVLAFSLFALQN